MANFMKIRPVGAELFHVDGQINMTKLTVAFHNFANAPKRDKHFILNLSAANYFIFCKTT
jgi:hypothetical protein